MRTQRITKYTYEIYKAEDLTDGEILNAKPVYTFSSDTLKEQKLKLGENNLEDKTDYCFKVIEEYNDNYKYNEIETGLSNYFQVIGRPTIEFKEELVDFNQIVGTVKIKDEGCTIPNEGRECKDKPEMNKVNDFIIRYYGGNSTTRIAIKDVKFDPETMEYKLALSGLKENTLYTFEVYADIDMHNGKGLQKGQYIGSFAVTTKGIRSIANAKLEAKTI